jgi:hypothetical protein
LYALCISAKRYVLFNLGPASEIIIRKASAHGLGQYLSPYEDKDAPNSIPPPSVKLDDIGVERWQYDLWYKIIQATAEGHPDQVDLSYHHGLKQPAVSRYGATTPALLKWFQTFNSGREYADQVKPFNFLSAFHAPPQFELPDLEQWAKPKRGRPRKQLDVKPIAAFNRNVREAAGPHSIEKPASQFRPMSSKAMLRHWPNIISGLKLNFSTATIATADGRSAGMSSQLKSSTSARKRTNWRSSISLAKMKRRKSNMGSTIAPGASTHKFNNLS